MICADNFWHGSHTNSICSHFSKHLYFSWSFICGTSYSNIYTILNRNRKFFCALVCMFDQSFMIGGRHIREALSKFVVVRICLDRKSTRLNSSHVAISYAVFCLKNKNTKQRVYY